MKAKVRNNSKVLTVTAFGGKDYSTREWKDVPADSEEEARRHPNLEIIESKPESKPSVEPEMPTKPLLSLSADEVEVEQVFDALAKAAKAEKAKRAAEAKKAKRAAAKAAKAKAAAEDTEAKKAEPPVEIPAEEGVG